MFPRYIGLALAIMAGGLMDDGAPAARAGVVDTPALLIVSQSVRVNFNTGDASFSITFDHTPDFALRDDLGRRADSFQYEIAPNFTDINLAGFFDIGAVVRGDEIHANRLPIRAGIADGSDPSPSSGGWGPLRGIVPYTLAGPKMTFAVPLQTLAAPDGVFAYRVFTTHFGETESLATGNSLIPLPPAIQTGLMMLAAMAGAEVIRRARRTPHYDLIWRVFS